MHACENGLRIDCLTAGVAYDVAGGCTATNCGADTFCPGLTVHGAGSCQAGEFSAGGVATCSDSAERSETNTMGAETDCAADVYSLAGEACGRNCPYGKDCSTGSAITDCTAGEYCAPGSSPTTESNQGYVQDETKLWYQKYCDAGHVCQNGGGVTAPISGGAAELVPEVYYTTFLDPTQNLECSLGSKCNAGVGGATGRYDEICPQG